MFQEQRLVQLIDRVEVPDNQRDFIEDTDRYLLFSEINTEEQINASLGDLMQSIENITGFEFDPSAAREQLNRDILGRYIMVEDSYDNIPISPDGNQNELEQITQQSIAADFYAAESFSWSSEDYHMSSREKFVLFNLLREHFFECDNDGLEPEERATRYRQLLEQTCESSTGRHKISGRKLLNIFSKNSTYTRYGQNAFYDLGFGIESRSGENSSRWIYRERSIRLNVNTWTPGSRSTPINEVARQDDTNGFNSPFFNFFTDELDVALEEKRADCEGDDDQLLDYHASILEMQDIDPQNYYQYLPDELANLPEQDRISNMDRLVQELKNSTEARNLRGLVVGDASNQILYNLILQNSGSDIIDASSWANSVIWIRQDAQGNEILIRKNVSENFFTVYEIGVVESDDAESNDEFLELKQGTEIQLGAPEAVNYFALITEPISATSVERQLEERKRVIPPETIDEQEALSNLKTGNFEFEINDGSGMHIEYDRSNPNRGRIAIRDSIFNQLKQGGNPDQFLVNTSNINEGQIEQEFRFIAEFVTNEIISQLPDEPEILVFRAHVNLTKEDEESNPEVTFELDISETQEEYARESAIVDARTFRQNTFNRYLDIVNTAIEDNFILALLIENPADIATNLAANGRDPSSITPQSLTMIAISTSGLIAGIPFVGGFLSRILNRGGNKTIDDIPIPESIQRRIGDTDLSDRPTPAPTRTPDLVHSSNFNPSNEPIPEQHSSIQRRFIKFEENVRLDTDTRMFLARGTKIEGNIAEIVFANESGQAVTMTPDNGTSNTYTLSEDLYINNDETLWNEGTTIDGRYHYFNAPDDSAAVAEV